MLWKREHRVPVSWMRCLKFRYCTQAINRGIARYKLTSTGAGCLDFMQQYEYWSQMWQVALTGGIKAILRVNQHPTHQGIGKYSWPQVNQNCFWCLMLHTFSSLYKCSHASHIDNLGRARLDSYDNSIRDIRGENSLFLSQWMQRCFSKRVDSTGMGAPNLLWLSFQQHSEPMTSLYTRWTIPSTSWFIVRLDLHHWLIEMSGLRWSKVFRSRSKGRVAYPTRIATTEAASSWA